MADQDKEAGQDQGVSLIETFPLAFFNSLTREKEDFKPIHAGYVGMYVCGPTVYGDPHLGHARSALTFDIIFRYLKFLGYKVRYVRNITDVGHLEDEVAEQGEDKIAKKARLEKLEPMEIVQTYTTRYRHAMERLNVLPPSIECTATGHIIEQIQHIEKILEAGFAYIVDGSVYFDLDKYLQVHDYGMLSGKKIEDLMSGSRDLDGQGEKKGPHDFALWKKARPEHIMRWPSPWGEGFPGWHIECTAMSTKYLGAPFDIHGGGLDLQFPHHEAEIAQATASCKTQPANYWIHNNLLTLDGEKMSKSKGNFITLDELFSGNHRLLEQAYTPMTVRFFMLQAHYRSPIDFSNPALQAAEKGYKRLTNSLEMLEAFQHNPIKPYDTALGEEIQRLSEACYRFMSDDFNTARALAALFEIAGKINAFYHKQAPLHKLDPEVYSFMKQTYAGFITQVLGLEMEKNNDDSKLHSVVNLLIEMRKEARQNKDFATSDKIRNELAAAGIQLKDEKSGETTFSID